VELPGAHGQDLALLGLLLGGVRDDQPGGGRLLGFQGLDHDAVLERLQHGLGGGRHCLTSPFTVLVSCTAVHALTWTVYEKKGRPWRPVVAGARPASSRLALYPRECQNGNETVIPARGPAFTTTDHRARGDSCTRPRSRRRTTGCRWPRACAPSPPSRPCGPTYPLPTWSTHS